MRRFMIMAVAAGLALTACATKAATSSAPAASRMSPQATNSGAPASPTPKASPRKHVKSAPHTCGPVRGGTEGNLAQLVDVRVGAHDGYDRVTFEFGPPADGQYFGLPPYQITAATPPITEDGSGEPVDMAGAHFAVLIFQGASGVEFNPDGNKLSYTGPKDFRPGFTALEEAKETGDFEAVLSWAFGLNSASCWQVHVLSDPMRVVIDFPHN
jgi:hypothetical protein